MIQTAKESILTSKMIVSVDAKELFAKCEDEIKSFSSMRMIVKVIVSALIVVLIRELIKGTIIRMPFVEKVYLGIVMIKMQDFQNFLYINRKYIQYDGEVPLCTLLPHDPKNVFWGYQRPVLYFGSKQYEEMRKRITNGKKYINEDELFL